MTDSSQAPGMRHSARQIWDYAMQTASVAQAFARNVEYSRGVLRVADDLFNLANYRKVMAISMGKAAHTMAAALSGQTGSLVGGIVAGVEASVESNVQTSIEAGGDRGAGSTPMLPGFRYFSGGHPLPTAGSMTAAGAILKSLHTLDADSLVIFLISGGASASVETPIDPEIQLQDLIATYRVLVHSGAPIAEINAIRKHLSAVKGGRMAAAAGGAHQVSIMVSDVPAASADDAGSDALASGPTMPDSTTVEDCHSIAARYRLVEKLPAPVRELFQRRALEETPRKNDPIFQRSRWWTILASGDAEAAAAAKATEMGFRTIIDHQCDDWDYQAATAHLLKRLREHAAEGTPACVISAGEVSVPVAGNPGTGGRNQQMALYAASQIAGENICFLSAGSDGIDGNSAAAGAIADGITMQRAADLDLHPEAALAAFNAYNLFHPLGDSVITGPTGNNIRDLRILLAW